MLGDRHAGTGDDEGRQRRDVVGAAGIAAGADDVDGIGRRFDRQHLGAHRGDGADDLVDGFAADAQRHQEAADLRRRRLAGHQDVEGLAGLLTVRGSRLAALARSGFRSVMRFRSLANGCLFGERLVDGRAVLRLQQVHHLIQDIVAGGIGHRR
jgi:hypothetical protein